jgi:hypothetical protein
MGELCALLFFEGNEYFVRSRKWMGESLKRSSKEIDGMSTFYEERLVMEYILQVTTQILQHREDCEGFMFSNDTFGIPFLLALSIGVNQKDVLQSIAPICLDCWRRGSTSAHYSMNICDLGSAVSLLKEHGQELGIPSHYLDFSGHSMVCMRGSKMAIAERFQLWGSYVSVCNEARKWAEDRLCCESSKEEGQNGIDVESGEENTNGEGDGNLDEGEVDESDDDGVCCTMEKESSRAPGNALMLYCSKHWPWVLPSTDDILCRWIIEILLMCNSCSEQPVDETVLREWWMGLLSIDDRAHVDDATDEGDEDGKGSGNVQRILFHLIERKSHVTMTTWNAVFDALHSVPATSIPVVHLWITVDHLSFVLPSDPAMLQWYDVVLKTAIGCDDARVQKSESRVGNISRWLVKKVILSLLQVNDVDLPHYQAMMQHLMRDSHHLRPHFQRVIEGKTEEYIHRIAYGVSPCPTKDRMGNILEFITCNRW